MIKKMLFASLALAFLTTSCNNDDDNSSEVDMSELTLNLDGLEDLGDDYVYEGWIIVDGTPISTGVFSSVTFPQTFDVRTSELEDASAFVLSIEPKVDDDPAPATTKILSGDFSGDTANVNSTGLVGDFSAASGVYILATPTDMDDTNEESGVWFLDNSSGTPETGLELPELNGGWIYEGWAVINGVPVSTGTFLTVSDFDDNAFTSPYKGDDGDGPSFPGEDFLQNAPDGLSFPTDLKGVTIVVSVEPVPDNSTAPFTFKPLAHVVPSDAMNHTVITMGEGPVSTISGSVNR
ncbi:anti-sigma factor [Formosa haliotis]|uniref:anti-sigma factor n=1 Tax=Formosa haliotis TaxID=1555194 RepID=UPI00082618F0|nr:anti-sigma factor [Formosa haliotis]